MVEAAGILRLSAFALRAAFAYAPAFCGTSGALSNRATQDRNPSNLTRCSYKKGQSDDWPFL